MNFFLVLREALRGIARTRIAGVIAVATIGVSLLVLGWFGQVIVGAHALVDRLREQVEIEVYFREGVSQQRVFALERALQGMSEVAGVAYVDQNAAAREFRALFGSAMVDALSRNPLPASLKVRIAPGPDMPRRARAVAMAVSDREIVEGVNVGDLWVDALARFVQVIIGVGIVLGSALCLACAFAVGNTTKSMALAQRDAIEIMRLVGATEATVRMPFWIGGAIQGVAGGLAASAMLSYVASWWTVRVPELAVRPSVEMGCALVVIGAVLGVIGSWGSLRK